MHQLHQQEKLYLLRNNITILFSEYCTSHQKDADFATISSLGKLIYFTQEIILGDANICLVVRSAIANQQIFRITDDLVVKEIDIKELLNLLKSANELSVTAFIYAQLITSFCKWVRTQL